MAVPDAHWQLRRAVRGDIAALHRLTCDPLVFRYLFDGKAPPESALQAAIAASGEHFRDHGVGLWILAGKESACAGFVSLAPRRDRSDLELIYGLDPLFWGRGLATRMAASAVREGFAAPGIARIIAGADIPNVASIAVMQRIGMRLLGNADYPLGPGVEYAIDRDGARLAARVRPLPTVAGC